MILFLSLYVLAGCQGTSDSLLFADKFDRDHDGHVDHLDCAPDDPKVWGDADRDGRFSDQCEFALFKCVGTPESPKEVMGGAECYGDCDDDDPDIFTGFNNDLGEMEEDGQEQARLAYCEGGLGGTPPTWSSDGKDNDCDDNADVPDFDGDTIVDDEDCEPCDPDISPLNDEMELADVARDPDAPFVVGTYAYNGIDEDCDGVDVTDYDGDGDPGGTATGDCDERNPLINHFVAEQCDTVDWNCNNDPIDGFEIVGGELFLDVDAGAPADGVGSVGAPFQSIDEAFDALGGCVLAAAGYDVVIRIAAAGTPYETSAFADISALNDATHVTVRGEAGVTIQPQNTALSLTMSDEQTWTVEALSFVGRGRAVSAQGGSLVVTDSTFSGNSASQGAAISAYETFNLSMENVDVSNSDGSAVYAGPADFAINSITVSNGNFVNNSGLVGGALSIESARLDGFELVDSDFSGNRAITGAGGAVAARVLSIGGISLEQTNFAGNTSATSGGAMYVGGQVILFPILSTTFLDNIAGASGGAMHLDGLVGQFDFTSVTASGNSAGTTGGMLHLREPVLLMGIAGSMFSGNNADESGGVLYGSRGTDVLTVTTTTFEDNEAGESGGAIFLGGQTGELSMSGALFYRNLAEDGDGGGLLVEDMVTAAGTLDECLAAGSAEGCATIDDGVWEGNRASGLGGAISFPGTSMLSIRSTTASALAFSGNSATSGGAIFLGDPVGGAELQNLVFTADPAFPAGSYGGTIYSTGGRLSIVDSQFTDIVAAEGGSIYAKDNENLTISGCTFTGNESSYSGGAIYSNEVDELELYSSVFSGNQSGTVTTGYGGAVMVLGGASVALNNLEFTSNWAGGSGGALYSSGASSLTIADSVWTENVATGSGGAIYGTDITEVVRLDGRNEFSGNSADSSGGTAWMNGVSSFSMSEDTGESTYSDGGSGGNGGCWYFLDVYKVSIEHAQFHNCKATFLGGGIFASNSSLRVETSEFLGNIDGGGGGAIYGTDADVYITQSWFEGNSGPAVSNKRLDIDVLASIFVRNGDSSGTDPSVPSDILVKNMGEVSIVGNTFYDSQSPSQGATVTIYKSTVYQLDDNVFVQDDDDGYAIYYEGVGDYYLDCNLMYGNNDCDRTDLVGDCSDPSEISSNTTDEDGISNPDALFADLSTFEIDPAYVAAQLPSDCDEWGGEANAPAGTWPLTFP